jgi:predicted  nucleic acid-binding Zn-ribbon protein
MSDVEFDRDRYAKVSQLTDENMFLRRRVDELQKHVFEDGKSAEIERLRTVLAGVEKELDDCRTTNRVIAVELSELRARLAAAEGTLRSYKSSSILDELRAERDDARAAARWCWKGLPSNWERGDVAKQWPWLEESSDDQGKT